MYVVLAGLPFSLRCVLSSYIGLPLLQKWSGLIMETAVETEPSHFVRVFAMLLPLLLSTARSRSLKALS